MTHTTPPPLFHGKHRTVTTFTPFGRGVAGIFFVSFHCRPRGHHERMARRQDAWVTQALDWALQGGTIDWMIHIDNDELLHGSLSALDDVQKKEHIICARMRNAEAVYDDPSAQEHDGCFAAVRFRRCGDAQPTPSPTSPIIIADENNNNNPNPSSFCRAYDNKLIIFFRFGKKILR